MFPNALIFSLLFVNTFCYFFRTNLQNSKKTKLLVPLVSFLLSCSSIFRGEISHFENKNIAQPRQCESEIKVAAEETSNGTVALTSFQDS